MNYTDEFIKNVKEDPSEHARSAEDVRKYIKGSTAIYHGEPIKTLYIPKIFSKEAYEDMKEAGRTTYRILEKITERYLNDAEYRKRFSYPDGLEELVLFERGYSCMIPICRLDIFFNEEDHSFKFCEINTDGTSGMVEDLELNNALKHNKAYQEYRKSHRLQSFELFDSFVKVFLDVYKDWKSNSGEDCFSSEKEKSVNADKNCVNPETGKPFVAIVDFLEGSYFSDFVHFKDSFEKAGCECEIAEITKLRFENGKLLSPEGRTIDAVYRRAVTTDVFSEIDKIRPFIDAVEQKAVCCIGNFCTQVAHNKSLFKIIRDAETLNMLTDDEQKFVLDHFPFTGYLNSSSTGTELTVEDVINTKDRWIVKPLDLYGAREISVGSDLTQDEWKEKIGQLTDKGYIFQEYCYPYKSLNLALDSNKLVTSEWINMTGMYMYGGELAGFFSRIAPDKVIAGHYGGRTIATLVETS